MTVERVKYRPYSQQMLWTHIQDYKTSQGVQPYIQDQKLCKIAEKRLVQVRLDFDHADFANKEAQEFLTNSGAIHVAENLATFGFINTEPKEINQLNAWLNSPKHRETLDNARYTHSCLRCNQAYCVHLFADY